MMRPSVGNASGSAKRIVLKGRCPVMMLHCGVELRMEGANGGSFRFEGLGSRGNG